MGSKYINSNKIYKFIFRANKYSANDNESAFDAIMDMHKSTLRLNYYPSRSTAHTKGLSPINYRTF